MYQDAHQWGLSQVKQTPITCALHTYGDQPWPRIPGRKTATTGTAERKNESKVKQRTALSRFVAKATLVLRQPEHGSPLGALWHCTSITDAAFTAVDV